MAKRLGKRERALARLADELIGERRQSIQAQVKANLASPRDPKFARSFNGSSDSENRLKSGTHTGFRSPIRTESKAQVVSRKGNLEKSFVGPRAGWQRQAPLPTDHKLLQSLELGSKVQPIEEEAKPLRPLYATAPKVKPWTKTK